MKPSQVSHLLDQALVLNAQGKHLVFFLKGPPGVAKSALVNDAARRNGVGFFDVRLSIKDTVDLTGVPEVRDGKTFFAAPGWLPGPDFCGFIFLDEYAQAMLSMQNVGGQLIYDRKAGDYVVPAGAVIVLASNRQQDRAGTTQTPQQINNRVIHINVDPDFDDWRTWAVTEGDIDQRIIAYLDWQRSRGQDVLCVPSKDAEAFPSFRTWEFASHVLSMELPEVIRTETLRGTVGDGPGSELAAFLNTYENLISWREVLKNPSKAPLPQDAAATFALLGSLSRQVSVSTFDALITYLRRLSSREMANYCVADAARLHPEVTETKAYVDWSIDHRIAA